MCNFHTNSLIFICSHKFNHFIQCITQRWSIESFPINIISILVTFLLLLTFSRPACLLIFIISFSWCCFKAKSQEIKANLILCCSSLCYSLISLILQTSVAAADALILSHIGISFIHMTVEFLLLHFTFYSVFKRYCPILFS